MRKPLVSIIAIISLLFLSCFMNIGPNAQTVYASTTDGLVGYWKFDEGTGTTVSDSSGNGNTGTLVNNPQWVEGKQGSALNFNGVNSYVNIPDSESLRVQSLTLSVWIYMTERPYQHGTTHSTIINKLYYTGGTGTSGYKLQFEFPTSTNDRLVVSIGDGNNQKFLVEYNSINDLTLHEWHHVVGTWNGNLASIYIDGQLKTSTTTEAYIIVHDSTSLALGTETTSGVKDVWFKGKIDEAMIYNRALSSEEVTQLFNNIPQTSPTPSPSPTATVTPSPSASPTASAAPSVTPVPTGSIEDSENFFSSQTFLILVVLVVVAVVIAVAGVLIWKKW